MKIIKDTAALEEVCNQFATHAYVTVDTEFLRESTFWPELCLIQLAGPDDECIVDVMADNISLAPFFSLMADESVVKVFHSARQDIEIIHHLGNLIPHPVFDTQVAAMVCGYGDSIAYDQLVMRITGTRLDKSSRFTNWSKRPLSDKQLTYALGDVTYLREVYESIKGQLKKQNRSHWVDEEMEVLTSVSTYEMKPEDAWKRLKMKSRKPVEFALTKLLAEWRETRARELNIPRGRVIRDDGIYEVASRPPRSMKELSEMRGLSKGFDKNRFGKDVLELVEQANAINKVDLPEIPKQRRAPEGTQAVLEILKVLLKVIVEKHGVAARVIATVDELEQIAIDDSSDVPALKGWRRELFGEKALAMKKGELLIGFNGNSVDIVERSQA